MIEVDCNLEEKSWTITVDDEPWIETTVTIIGRRPRFKKAYPDRESWEKAFYEREQKGAFHYACRCLTRRSYPSKELEGKLKRKGVSPQGVETVMAKLTRIGLVNDEEWLEQSVRSQMRRQYGPARIIQNLQIKGFSREEIQDCLNEQMSDEHCSEQIQAILEKRYAKCDLGDPKQKRRVIQALMRKGYSYGDILDSISN